MTIAHGTAGERHQESLDALRRVLPGAGYGLAAGELSDPAVAGWAAAHCVTVFADDDQDLDELCRNGIRPVQVVLRCGDDIDRIRRGIGMGITRFMASDDDDIAALAEYAHRDTYVYLDVTAAPPQSRRRAQIIGLSCTIDEFDGYLAWPAAADRMLCRLATLHSCGLRPNRICLIGGSSEMALVAAAVRDAIDDGCARWRQPAPKIVLAPRVGAPEPAGLSESAA
jgi:hypothetical protein